MKRQRLALAVALAAVIATAACGSSDSGGSDEPASGASPSALVNHLKDQGEINVAVNVAPPNLIENTDGSWSGIYPDMVKYIGEQLGVKVNFTKVDWTGMIAGVQSDRYDMALVLAVTPDREKAINFSQPVGYQLGTFYLDKTKNKATTFAQLNQPDQTICTAEATIYDIALQEVDLKAKTLYLSGWDDCISALQAGRATTVLWGWQEATTFLPDNPDYGVIFPDPPLGFGTQAIVMAKKYGTKDLAPINTLVEEWHQDPARLSAALEEAGVHEDPLDFAIGTVPDYAKDALVKGGFTGFANS